MATREGFSFRKEGVFAIHVTSNGDRDRLLDALERLGIRGASSYRGVPVTKITTNVYAVDIHRKDMDYLGQPSICAAMASSGVRFYSVAEFCKLSEHGFPANTRCPVFHIPHDGGFFPGDLTQSVCIPKNRFFDYHEKMRDQNVSDMVPKPYCGPHQYLYFPYSRLLCDVERLLGPEESMERYGMGYCYERAYDGTKIKTVTEEVRSITLRYYREHHSHVDYAMSKRKRVVFFDLHSFSEEIVPQEYWTDGRETPDVCLGVDTRYTPEALAALAEHHFQAAGFTTERNYPYEGCYIPDLVLSGDSCDFIGIMTEFNKRIYCHSDGSTDYVRVEQLKGILEQLTADAVLLP